MKITYVSKLRLFTYAMLNLTFVSLSSYLLVTLSLKIASIKNTQFSNLIAKKDTQNSFFNLCDWLLLHELNIEEYLYTYISN